MRNCILSLAAGWVIVVFCIYCCCTHSHTKFPNPRFTTFSIIKTTLPTQSLYKIIILRTRNQHNLYQIINIYQQIFQLFNEFSEEDVMSYILLCRYHKKLVWDHIGNSFEVPETQKYHLFRVQVYFYVHTYL